MLKTNTLAFSVMVLLGYSSLYVSCSAAAHKSEQSSADLLSEKSIAHILKFKKIKIIDNCGTKVAILEDPGTKDKFALKRIDPEAGCHREPYELISDVIGSKIAEELELPVNRVRIVPPHLLYDSLATIHTFVSGKTHRGIDYIDFSNSASIKKLKAACASLAPADYERFLSKLQSNFVVNRMEVLNKIVSHFDIAQIAALDTFLGNNDRNEGNLFTDQGRFVGIDLGASFTSQVADNVLEGLIEISEQEPVSEQIKLGLQEYKQTLQRLVIAYPLDKIILYAEESLATAGLYKKAYIVDTERYLALIKVAMSKNISTIERLIPVIDKIIGRY